MRLYFDSAYIAKCYLNEPDHLKVRKLATGASGLYSSAWCVAELACVFHRHVREGSIRQDQAAELRHLFLRDLQNGVWMLLPVSETLLYRVEAAVESLPRHAYLRAGDAVHLVTAQEAGFPEIWSNDSRLLAAAAFFGLAGRSVSSNTEE